MKLELLEDLYRKALAELLDAEKQMARVLPKMADAASEPELRSLLEMHAKETAEQANRLKKLIGASRSATAKSKSMVGMIAEVKDLLAGEAADRQLRDAALIAAGQKAEALEITGYACAHNFARLLGFNDDLKPLEQSFREEETMEERLSAMAEALNVEELESESELRPEAQGTAQNS